jgi:prephenate dehydrogenase
MSVQITIIGTGQIGASIGLALEEHKDMFVRVGHDKDVKVANRAKDMGALDRVETNLPRSVEEAEIVILALPLDQIRATLKFIVLDLKDEVVIMDTAPVKSDVLETPGSGVEAAHADLFKGGLMAILSAPGVPSEVIKLATDFSHLLGAEHMFIDPVELDSMMAATHILPQLIAAALINTTVDQPGWLDARKLAGRPYAVVTSALAQFDEANSLATQAITSQAHLVRWINAVMDNLDVMRQELASQDAEKFVVELEKARAGREKWLREKNALSWAATESATNVELPTARQIFTSMFTFGGGKKPKPK